ncbi:hypothetical protein [Roseomonas populi]|uniref:Phage late control D family protein n=1 Tax=Roseomonas populi TaxID=3121582 RepID=A0ABT1X4Q3_9PROT|nr:hypothetical protein [Roseomonas pecuniae]MCR0982756.1 hypothetical protein [Roseomonas pecuniae]
MALLDSVHLTMLIGPTLPLPAPPTLMEALQSVEVTHRDDGPNGFQISFSLGRGSLADVLDYGMLLGPVLKPFNRVILVVTHNGLPAVLMDGVVTHRQHAPDTEPGSALVTITGEDVSVMMDLEEKRAAHPCLPDMAIAAKIMLGYAKYAIVPDVRPPMALDMPLPVMRVPMQVGTDLQMLRGLAARNGFVFYVEPGPVPGTNRGYWGPPKRLDLPQPALNIGMGRDSNGAKLQFEYDALAPAVVGDTVQDSVTGARLPVRTFASTRLPPLVLDPATTPLHTTRSVLASAPGGLNMVQAYGRAQAVTDNASDAVVTARGEVDTLRYGRALRARGLVGVRGAGYTHDGLYYVKRVTHKIGPGTYTQDVTLTREGETALLPVVVP